MPDQANLRSVVAVFAAQDRASSLYQAVQSAERPLQETHQFGIVQTDH